MGLLTTCAVVVARDEADIVEVVVRHLLWHVDEVICADHRSVDGTREIMESLPVVLFDVKERGYWGDRTWTWLAGEAFKRGHGWVVVNDADEVWHPRDDPEVRVADFLAAVPGEALVVGAFSFNHIPSAADDEGEPNPVVRIGWRQGVPDTRKVACRLTGDVSYAKHSAWYGGEAAPPSIAGLTVRHFTIRTAEQLITKVRNGMDGYSVEAGMPEGFDAGWSQWKGLADDEIRERFHTEFWSADPSARLVYDPAPLRKGGLTVGA